MIINKELWFGYGASIELLKYIDEHKLDGTELIDFVGNKETPFKFRAWCYVILPMIPEEVAAYKSTLCIENSEDIYNSDEIYNSKHITNSLFVTNCQDVWNSEQVTDANDIYGSSYVKNSNHIYDSKFVSDSHIIFESNNITLGSNIAASTFCSKSLNIFKSQNISLSQDIVLSNNLEGCYNCLSCSNLKNAIFCCGAHDDDYLLFNQKISPEQYELILSQHTWIFKCDNPIYYSISEDETMHIINDLRKHYKPYSTTVKDWIKTLPNYDNVLMFSITHDSYWLT